MSLPLIFEKSRVDAVALNKKESSLYVGQSKDIIDANVVGYEIEILFLCLSKYLSCLASIKELLCHVFWLYDGHKIALT